MSDEERNDGQGSEAPEAPAPPRYEIRPTGSGSHGDEYIDGVGTGERVPLRDYGGTGVVLGQPMPDADEVETIRRENAELKARFERDEPYLRLAAKPGFKELVTEYVERGEIEAPVGQPPDPEDIVAHRKRMSEPEAETILASMREYAETLPEWQQDELQRNHKTFNAVYDRFKRSGAGSLPRPPMPAAYPQVPMDRRTLETILRSKEVDRARIERPGNTTPEYPEPEDTGGEKAWKKALDRQARAYNTGRPIDREKADNALVEAFFERKSPRRSTGGGY